MVAFLDRDSARWPKIALGRCLCRNPFLYTCNFTAFVYREFDDGSYIGDDAH